MKQQRNNKSLDAVSAHSAHINDLAHDGRGVARVNGKAVFVHDALPGEDVRFVYTRRRSQHDEGRLLAIESPAVDRVAPRCAHFGVCGGCSLQHLDAARQIAYKQDWLLDNLKRIGKVEPQTVLTPIAGSSWRYRRKARLGLRYVQKKGRVLVGFRERNNSFVADLQACEVLYPPVGALINALGELVQTLSIYDRVPQIEMAAGDRQTALVFRVLAPPSENDKTALIAFAKAHALSVYLQPGGPDSSYLLWPESATLSYQLSKYDLSLQFTPYQFIQVNAEINQKMIDLALELLAVQTSDKILDLFCGLGNFTLPLARQAQSVTGIEGDAGLVTQAERNAQTNRIDNVRFYTADLIQAIHDLPWLREPYDKILLDPPRPGALALMPQIAKLAAKRIVYVSCHPATLARDASELVHRFGYKLASAGVMDMFPHTAHVESIALFVRD